MGTFVFKIVLVGDYGVGKSTSIHRFVEDKFKASYVPTLGVQISKKTIAVDEHSVELLIWDLAGQDRYLMIRQRFYTGTQGILMLYDITRKSSLDHINRWYKEVIRHSGPIPIVLIGNKIDLEDKREVFEDDVNGILQENNIDVKFKIETSAKDGFKTNEAFLDLVKYLIGQNDTSWLK